MRARAHAHLGLQGQHLLLQALAGLLLLLLLLLEAVLLLLQLPDAAAQVQLLTRLLLEKLLLVSREVGPELHWLPNRKTAQNSHVTQHRGPRCARSAW